MDTRELILKHLAPGLGCIVAFIMFFSPFKAVQAVRKSGTLGDLNPLPLVAIIANCLGWLVYGSVLRDPYVIAANEPGLLLGVYMTVTAYGYASPKARDTMLKAVMFFAAIISVTSLTINFFIADHADRATAAGYQAVGILLIYYAAPLSVIAEVLRTRSSARLYWPLSVMSCVNGSLWVAYGLAVGDAFIWAPNAVGAAFGVLQLGLIGAYPAKPGVGGGRASSDEDDEDDVRQPLNRATE